MEARIVVERDLVYWNGVEKGSYSNRMEIRIHRVVHLNFGKTNGHVNS